jgi:putative component of toxin-antitoxin plasmid stabilization module
MSDGPFTLEFYRDPYGDEPVRRWMEKSLSPDQRGALDAALIRILAVHGVGVCGTHYGSQLGHGLFEFRLEEKSEGILLRVFCHATGDRVILLLAGYDKGRDPSHRRQQREIARARARMAEFAHRRRD